MIHQVFNKLDQLTSIETAQAHCDIPCGIYDPHASIIAALSVIRMIDLMNDLTKERGSIDDMEYIHGLTRYIAVKEEHAEICKHEVRVIFGDYIKKEHLEKYPELPGLFHQIMQLASKARQTAARQNALDLLNAVNRFAEIFWETKGIAVHRVAAPYKPGEEMVLPQL
jgi:nickel superoxide dismutase